MIVFDRYVWPYRKAFVAGLLAGLAMLYSDYPGGITGQEWFEIAFSAAASAAAVWGIKNAPMPPKEPKS